MRVLGRPSSLTPASAKLHDPGMFNHFHARLGPFKIPIHVKANYLAVRFVSVRVIG